MRIYPITVVNFEFFNNPWFWGFIIWSIFLLMDYYLLSVSLSPKLTFRTRMITEVVITDVNSDVLK